MNTREFARRIPKVDLHCHLTGSIDLEFALELAAEAESHTSEDIRRAYDLQASDPRHREEDFFVSLDIVAGLLRTPDHLATAAYRIAHNGSQRGNLRYLELFVNPTALQRTGMSFVEVRDGLLAGASRAEEEIGVTVNFIACFLRDEPLELSERMLDDLITHRTPKFVGVGLDGPEDQDAFRPSNFIDLYHRAAEAGFHRTAHFTESEPRDLAVCLDKLGCERIDHGYPIIDDPAMLERGVASAVPFTCCPTITRDISSGLDARYLQPETHPIGIMRAAGINMVFGTDDGALVGTDIGTEYALISEWYGLTESDARIAALRGIEASWASPQTKAALRAEVAAFSA